MNPETAIDLSNSKRLLVIGLGNGGRACLNQLPDCKDWVKAVFLRNSIASIHADRIFNYSLGSSVSLDGGAKLAADGIAQLHGEIINLVNDSSCDAVIIFCCMGGESAYGLENLVESIRVSKKPIYLISSLPFAGEGKRKLGDMRACLDLIVDRLSGIYLLDLEEVIQYVITTTKGLTLLEFFRYCDTIILNFFRAFVNKLEILDKNIHYIFLYHHLEAELIVQQVPSLREGLNAVL